MCQYIQMTSWVRKVLSIFEAHLSLGTLHSPVALVAGVSMVFILQADD